MGWSAASCARGLTTGKRGRLVPSYTARRPIGRATGGSAGNETQGKTLSLRSGTTKKGGKTARRHPMKIHTIGIDLGKTSFHLAGLNERGEVIVRKRFSRAQLLRFTANRKVHVIGMEACGGAHYLGRALQEQAHEVRLIPAQYVKPYVKTNKSDYIEAEAMIEQTVQESEACQRLMQIPGIGPVTATAVISAIGNGAAFRKGREFAAWTGLVPREHSTGGKQKLLGISKRGNRYLRKLFVQCARAVLQQKTKQTPGL